MTVAPRFLYDWFSRHIPTWETQLGPLAGRPGLTVLEIGSYEGRSTLWLLEHVVTHPTSRIVCIDIFERKPEYDDFAIDMDHLLDRFLHNVGPHRDRVEVRQGFSHEQLKQLPGSSFDLIYVDAAHTAVNALEDMVLSWRLLKPSGVMCVDDYEWDAYAGTLRHPQQGIDCFLRCYEGHYELLHKDYQVFLRRL
jgi:predicted O-methyltransferase YrrM